MLEKVHAIDKRLTALEIQSKHQTDALDQISKILQRITWIVLTGVIVALLSTIVKAV